MTKISPFYNFPPVTAKAWKQQIQADLKGADYNERLIWDSPDHISVKPFYNSEDLKNIPDLAPQTPATWHIGQSIYVQNAVAANKKALHAINKGAESIFFTLPSEDTNIEDLLKGIDLTATPIHLTLQFLSTQFMDRMSFYSKKENTLLHIHLDVIGHLAASGNWHRSMEEDLSFFAIQTEKLGQLPFLSVDGTLYQNAGANMIQQLAYMLSHANEYLNSLVLEGKKTLPCGPVFKVAVNTDYFFEIAKIRALRILWATLATAYEVPTSCEIVAQPTKRNKTLYDYNTNLLRTTTESMAGILGGANTVCNLAYDAIYHKDNEFGERIARNQLLILKNESYFGAVSNPADGAYYIESLTYQLANDALELFKALEHAGGFLKGLKSHTIQKKIKESAEKEQQRFDQGTLVLVGSNKYANQEDKMKDSIEIYPFLKTNKEKTLLEPILEKRLAEALEQKRLEDE
jgi:methylmalonyl-CoA mutase